MDAYCSLAGTAQVVPGHDVMLNQTNIGECHVPCARLQCKCTAAGSSTVIWLTHCGARPQAAVHTLLWPAVGGGRPGGCMMMHWAQETCATHVHSSAREGSACLGSGQQEHQRRCNSQDFFAQDAMPLLCKPTLLSGQLRSAMQCFSCCVGQEGHLLPSHGANGLWGSSLHSATDWPAVGAMYHQSGCPSALLNLLWY